MITGLFGNSDFESEIDYRHCLPQADERTKPAMALLNVALYFMPGLNVVVVTSSDN